MRRCTNIITTPSANISGPISDGRWETYAVAPATEESSVSISLRESVYLALFEWKIKVVDADGRPCEGARLEIWAYADDDGDGDSDRSFLLAASDGEGSPIFQGGGRGYLSGQRRCVPHSVGTGGSFPDEYYFFSCNRIVVKVLPGEGIPPGAKVRYYGFVIWESDWDNWAPTPDLLPFPAVPSIVGPESAQVNQLLVFSGAGSIDVGAFGQPDTIDKWTWTLRRPDNSEQTYSGGSLSEFSFTPTMPGAYLLRLDVTGVYKGISADSDAILINVSSQPVQLSAEANGPYFGYRGDAIQFSSTGSLGAASYRWEFGDGTVSTAASPTHSYTRPGTYAVRLTVYDSGGNSTSDTSAVVVYNRQPTAVISGPDSVYTGETFTLSASDSIDPDGDPLRYAWEFLSPGISGGSGASSVDVTAWTPGTKLVRLTVSDPYGAQDVIEKQFSVLKTAPIAEANGPYSGPVGYPIKFSSAGSRSPDLRGPLSFRWEFGDGTTADAANPEHVYAEPGTYTATLTVCDIDGYSATDTASVSIYSYDITVPELGSVIIEPVDHTGVLCEQLYYFLPRWMDLYYRDDTVLGRFLDSFAPMLTRARFEVLGLKAFGAMSPWTTYPRELWLTRTEGIQISGSAFLVLGSKRYPIRRTESLWDLLTASDPVMMTEDGQVLFRNLHFVEETLSSEDGFYALTMEPTSDENVWYQEQSGWIRVPPGSDLRVSGGVQLSITGARTFRYQAFSVGDPVVEIGEASIHPNRIDLWNPVDDYAQLLGVRRLQRETNQDLIDRVSLVRDLSGIFRAGAMLGLAVRLFWDGRSTLDLDSFGFRRLFVLGLPERSTYSVDLLPTGQAGVYSAPAVDWEPGWYVMSDDVFVHSSVQTVGSRKLVTVSGSVTGSPVLVYTVKNYDAQVSGGVYTTLAPTAVTPSGSYEVIGVRDMRVWCPMESQDELFTPAGLPTDFLRYLRDVTGNFVSFLSGWALWGHAYWFSEDEVTPGVSLLPMALDFC